MWEIRYYVPSSGGISPVALFIEKLPKKAQAKLSNTFSLLESFGIQIGTPHLKKLSGVPLYEIRILGQDNIRIFYIVPQKDVFLLLHGFVKKKQKTPRKDIKVAMERLKDYQRRS